MPPPACRGRSATPARWMAENKVACGLCLLAVNRLRILVMAASHCDRQYLAALNRALARGNEVVCSNDAFWTQDGGFDVVHIHSPEALVPQDGEDPRGGAGAIGSRGSRFEERLGFWSQRSVLVVTRHDMQPDGLLGPAPPWGPFYEAVYRYADGVVHFTEESVQDFRARYARTTFHRGAPRHVVVPFHGYAGLPDELLRDEAREILGIRKHRRVMLVYGDVGSEAEWRLALRAFRRARVPGKTLLVTSTSERLPAVSWIRLRCWLRSLMRFYHRLHPRQIVDHGIVDDAEVQVYLRAADILFVPRSDLISPACAVLGMTFGRVVVGPDCLGIGETLRETGNPVFDPRHPWAAVQAVERGFILADAGHLGLRSRVRVTTEWGADSAAESYLRFFSDLREARPQGVHVVSPLAQPAPAPVPSPQVARGALPGANMERHYRRLSRRSAPRQASATTDPQAVLFPRDRDYAGVLRLQLRGSGFKDNVYQKLAPTIAFCLDRNYYLQWDGDLHIYGNWADCFVPFWECMDTTRLPKRDFAPIWGESAMLYYIINRYGTECINRVWKFNAAARTAVDSEIGRLGLPPNYVSTQVRRGDKLKIGQVPRIPAEEIAAAMPLGTRNLFVATDDYTVVEEFRSAVADLNIITTCRPAHRGSSGQNEHFMDGAICGKRAEMVRLLVDLDVCVRSSHFVRIRRGPERVLDGKAPNLTIADMISELRHHRQETSIV